MFVEYHLETLQSGKHGEEQSIKVACHSLPVDSSKQFDAGIKRPYDAIFRILKYGEQFVCSIGIAFGILGLQDVIDIRLIEGLDPSLDEALLYDFDLLPHSADAPDVSAERSDDLLLVFFANMPLILVIDKQSIEKAI